MRADAEKARQECSKSRRHSETDARQRNIWFRGPIYINRQEARNL